MTIFKFLMVQWFNDLFYTKSTMDQCIIYFKQYYQLACVTIVVAILATYVTKMFLYVYRKWKVWRSKTKEVRPLFDRPTTSTNTCSRSNSNDSLDDSMNQSRSNKAKKKASIIRYLIQVELTKTNWIKQIQIQFSIIQFQVIANQLFSNTQISNHHLNSIENVILMYGWEALKFILDQIVVQIK